ncbi:MAG: oxidoreductase [Gemmatimonadetes bacterium]|nr:oxidoreductase [Gemmatimonadota bacterium]
MAIRIGVIGCARILNAHLRGFKILQEAGFGDLFQVTALCARKEEDALRFRKRGEGPGARPDPIETPGDPLNAPHMYIDDDLHPGSPPVIYTDYRAMLAEGPVDAVVVYTGHDSHHTIAVDAMRAGKHVAVEKAMAITVKAAQQMCEVATETDRVLSVDENVFFSPATRGAKWVVEQGTIGEVQMIFRGIIGFPSHRPDLATARTPWRHSRLGAGGGVSIDLGVHLFNGIRQICGPVASVGATWRVLEETRVLLTDDDSEVAERIPNEVDDAFFSNFRLENGGLGHAAVARSSHGRRIGVPGGTNVWGSRGALSDGRYYTDGESGSPLGRMKAADPAGYQAAFPNGVTDAYALEQLDWLQAIDEGRKPEMTGEEGTIDLALAYAILESGLLKREVTLEEVLSGEVDAYQQPINQHYGL